MITRKTTMKSIGTPNYQTAFWNIMKKSAQDASLGYSASNSFVLPTVTEAKFKQEQARNNTFRSLTTVVFVNAENRVKTLLPAGDAAFVMEGGTIPDVTADLINRTINPHKVVKMTKLSNETLRDSGFDMEAALAADFGRVFGSVEENGIVNGDGASQPYGLLHATEGAQVGATSAAAGTISADDIRSLYFSLDRKYRRNAV